MRERFAAPIPPSRQQDGLCWLVIEHDTDHTRGWFLFFHPTLEGPCKYDQWHLTREDADAAAEDWGVTPDAWRPLESRGPC